MTLFEAEADGLNQFLDAHVRGRSIDPDDLDPALVETYKRVRALDARSAPEPRLMTDLWRSMMTTIPIEAEQLTAAVGPAFPSIPRLGNWDRRQKWIGLVATLGLVALLLAGTVGYQRFNGGSGESQPSVIPAAMQTAGTPTVTGCEAEPREPGSVAAMVETPQTQQPYLPRFGDDPIYKAISAGGTPTSSTGSFCWPIRLPNRAFGLRSSKPWINWSLADSMQWTAATRSTWRDAISRSSATTICAANSPDTRKPAWS
jgi:hypothetical protein